MHDCTLNIIYREYWLAAPNKQYKGHNEEEKISLFFFQTSSLSTSCVGLHTQVKTPACSIKYLKLLTALCNHFLAVKVSAVSAELFCTIHIPIKTKVDVLLKNLLNNTSNVKSPDIANWPRETTERWQNKRNTYLRAGNFMNSFTVPWHWSTGLWNYAGELEQCFMLIENTV